MKNNGAQAKIDVVCGMDLAPYADSVHIRYQEKVFYFCGEYCAARFTQSPEQFIGEPLIRLDTVWKVFRLGATAVEVLKGFSLNIWRGDFVAIIGASGSGKSTALNMIGLLDRPTSGTITFANNDVSLLKDQERARLRSQTFGFVFQQYNLIPWLSAHENVALPMMFAQKNINQERLNASFREIGLENRMAHRPLELSGGEQQRIAVLRALANDPDIILADEPTGNLDSTTGNKILEMLANLNKTHNKTLVVVTHDADIAAKADQVVAIKDGRLVRNHKTYKYVE